MRQIEPGAGVPAGADEPEPLGPPGVLDHLMYGLFVVVLPLAGAAVTLARHDWFPVVSGCVVAAEFAVFWWLDVRRSRRRRSRQATGPGEPGPTQPTI